MDQLQKHKGYISAALFVGCLSLVIMLPLSFQYVDKNRVGFKKSTTTNQVDLSPVYTPGRYFWGLGHTSVQFPTTRQKIDFSGPNQLSIFTDGGQTMSLECVLFYQINISGLAQLYKKFGLGYHAQIVSIAQAEIRNSAPTFALAEFLTDRQNVSLAISQHVQTQLENKAFVVMTSFHLLTITPPATVLNQKLTIFTTNQQVLTANYSLQASLIRLNTSKVVAQIQNDGNVTLQNATAIASRVVANANSRQFKATNTEIGDRFSDLIDALNITNATTKKRLILYMQILDSDKSNTLLLTKGSSPIITLSAAN